MKACREQAVMDFGDMIGNDLKSVSVFPEVRPAGIVRKRQPSDTAGKIVDCAPAKQEFGILELICVEPVCEETAGLV
jgi:hypothetical protein